MLVARQSKPNKAEQRLEAFLTREFPGMWAYTGDGRVVLNGYVPDFMNTNGAKAILELFGDYWHSGIDVVWHRTELGRIMAYNSLGFRCLVIWEDELNDEVALRRKLKSFIKGKKGE